MTLSSLIENIRWRLSKIFLSEQQQCWQKAKTRNKCFKRGEIMLIDEYTPYTPIKHLDKERVICIYDGKTKNGGLADRIRGMISVYEVCKELKHDFKILFSSPFKLTNYLVPNKVNWEIQEDEINYNTSITDICCIDTFSDSQYESKKQKQWFRKELKKKYKEFHVRTNAIFSYNGDFSTLFNELFKPSTQLQASIDKQKAVIGESYISCSFRFMNLLDDFNEIVEFHGKLSIEEQKELIRKNLAQIEGLHSKHPNKRILVNSDSTTFLKAAAKFDYVYIIPGNITHIDNENDNNRYEAYEKTFLDFFMIANAEKVYLVQTGQMYNSGYPFAAAKIYNKPFEKIVF